MGQHGNVLEFSDPVYGTFTFTQRELQAYFCKVRTWDVLWPDGDKGCVEACASSSEDDPNVSDGGIPASAEDMAPEVSSLDNTNISNSGMQTPTQELDTGHTITTHV